MNVHRPAMLAGLFFLSTLPLSAASSYSVKTVSDSSPPKEVAEPLRKLLQDRCVQLLDDKGTVLMELWFRKEVPVKATDTQLKNGLTYAEVPLSTFVAVLRVPKQIYDYRKQKVKAGVYTLRLALQPMDGDHMGTAPYGEFCLICPAEDDKKPDLIEARNLHEISGRTTEGHPSILVLFPGKGATTEPKLVDKGEGHWVLMLQLDANNGATKAKMNVGLTLVGASAAA